jgi:hypothetical protein
MEALVFFSSWKNLVSNVWPISPQDSRNNSCGYSKDPIDPKVARHIPASIRAIIEERHTEDSADKSRRQKGEGDECNRFHSGAIQLSRAADFESDT